jgi:hypothetical protein
MTKIATQPQVKFRIAWHSCGQTNIYLKTYCKSATTYATHAYNNTTQELLFTEHQQESYSKVYHESKCEKPDQFINEITWDLSTQTATINRENMLIQAMQNILESYRVTK